MPLVRISLAQGKSASVKRDIADAIHRSLVEIFNVPSDDRFQVIGEHSPEDFVCTPEYLGIRHTADAVFIQITVSEGRSVEMKRTLFQSIADGIARNAGISSADVIINLLETKKENWSFGNGIAHYATQEALPAHTRAQSLL